MGELKGTAARSWKRPQTDKVLLPSGNEIVLRKPDLAALIMSDETGSVPEGLLNQVLSELNGVPAAAEWKPGQKDLPQMGKFIKRIVQVAALNPRIVDVVSNPDDEVAWEDVEQADRMKIFNWAMPAEVQAAGQFPQKPGANLELALDVQPVQPEPG